MDILRTQQPLSHNVDQTQEMNVAVTRALWLCVQLAATYMKGEDVSSLYIAQARQLEEQGKFKDAER